VNRETAVAVDAFREALEELGVNRRRGLTRPREFGRRAALDAASELLFRNSLERLLTRDEVQELLRVKTRQAVHDLVRRGQLIALPTKSGTHVYPAFQIDAARGRPYRAVAPAVAHLRSAFEGPMTIAGWFVSANELLDGATPAQWLARSGSDELLVEAARRDAGAAAH
jgi:hypothetical protein